MQTRYIQALMIAAIVGVVGFGIFYSPKKHSSALVDLRFKGDEQHAPKAPEPEPHMQPVEAKPRFQPQPPQHHHEPVHIDSVTAFSDLPETIQNQVRQLNANDNSLVSVEQVSPTVVRARLAGIHQSVPVAVVNDDGSVVIREY